MDDNRKLEKQLSQEVQMLQRQLNLLTTNNAELQKTQAEHRRLISLPCHTWPARMVCHIVL